MRWIDQVLGIALTQMPAPAVDAEDEKMLIVAAKPKNHGKDETIGTH